MTRARAAAGSLVFLLLAPGVVAGVVPWLLTGWDSTDPPLTLRVAGIVLIAGGAAVLVQAFARFAVEGIGTPAPVAPTERLVVGGLYRYVRNPMYVAVAATIVGQAALLGRPGLLLYALGFMAAVAAFVNLYEEPVLSERFGDEYERYRRGVPAWRPRLRPWKSDQPLRPLHRAVPAMPVLEVRPQKLRPGLSREPRGDDDGGYEQHGEDDADELVHDVTNDTPLGQGTLEPQDPPQDRQRRGVGGVHSVVAEAAGAQGAGLGVWRI